MSYHPEYLKLLLAEKLLSSVAKSTAAEVQPTTGDIEAILRKLDKVIAVVEEEDGLMHDRMADSIKNPETEDKHERIASRFMDLIGELGE